METKIEIRPGRNMRTDVFVNEEFAYQCANHPEIEREHLQALISLLALGNLDNIKVEVGN